MICESIDNREITETGLYFRFMFIASGIHFIARLRNSDRIYTPLPLYHTAGGIMAVGQSLLHGATTVIRKKFSASAYFSDCVKYNCTVRRLKKKNCKRGCCVVVFISLVMWF